MAISKISGADITEPKNPRAAVIFEADNDSQESVIRSLMLIMGAGRYFKTEDFVSVHPAQYNFYVIGGPVTGGRIDEKILGFILNNSEWLIQKRIVLFGFCEPGEQAESVLQSIADSLGDAVIGREVIHVDASRLDMESVVRVGARFRSLKEKGSVSLEPSEVREHIERFLHRRKHCVLSTGYGDSVRGTSVSYFYNNGHIYIMCEGSGKFANIILNDNVCVALFAPPTSKSKVAGLQLTGRVSIWHPDSEEYRRIVKIKGSDYERLRSLPFILWALDVKVEKAEFWWADLAEQGFAPKQVYYFF